MEKKRDFRRLAFFPIQYPILEGLYQKQKNMFWTTQELNFTNDRSQWDRTTDEVRTFLGFLVALFVPFDGIVGENLIENFVQETSSYAKECSMFYAIQAAVEWVHNETYSHFVKTFYRDPEEQEEILNSIETNPAVRKIADWAFIWMDNTKPLLERVIAFTCIEGIIFSSAFAGIYWVKRMNILAGLTKANEWIARDEALHTEFGVALYHHLTKLFDVSVRLEPLPESRVHEIISSSVDATENFVRTAMQVELVGLNADDMVAYVKTTADVLCKSLGYNPIYKTKNPFDWMAIISLPNKSNFFETGVTEYARESNGNDDEFDLYTPF